MQYPCTVLQQFFHKLYYEYLRILRNQDKMRNYYFRVRSKRDEKGNIISGYYGKIYGEFPEITYYLNPVVNDRNIEFDVNRNLFLKLGGESRITVP